jgi:copper chaperone NosL
MKKGFSILTAALAACLVVVYFVPMWSINLEAPQYPEGLGMKIWIHKLGGDINTINGLNHYIGMQKIEEDSIPELKLMPWFLGLLIILGGVAAWLRKKWFFAAWVSVFAILGVTAGYDFWAWEYDYGHNLNPTAAIRIPGMSYQPPLLGSKQLLNFTAHSYPDIGGVIIMGTGIMLVLMVLYLYIPRLNKAFGLLLLAATGGLVSCSSEPVPIQYGRDSCIRCRMIITDTRFGTEIVTKKGKVLYFDSIECLMRYYQSDRCDKTQTGHIMITDASAPGALIPAEQSAYLISENYPSPMGDNLSGFATVQSRDQFLKEYGGQGYSWAELVLKYSEKPKI